MLLLDNASDMILLNPLTIFILLGCGLVLIAAGISVLVTGIKGIKNKKENKVSAGSIVCTCVGATLIVAAIVMIVLSIRGMTLWMGTEWFKPKSSSQSIPESSQI